MPDWAHAWQGDRWLEQLVIRRKRITCRREQLLTKDNEKARVLVKSKEKEIENLNKEVQLPEPALLCTPSAEAHRIDTSRRRSSSECRIDRSAALMRGERRTAYADRQSAQVWRVALSQRQRVSQPARAGARCRCCREAERRGALLAQSHVSLAEPSVRPPKAHSLPRAMQCAHVFARTRTRTHASTQCSRTLVMIWFRSATGQRVAASSAADRLQAGPAPASVC